MKSKRIWWNWKAAALALTPFLLVSAVNVIATGDWFSLLHPVRLLGFAFLIAIVVLVSDFYARDKSR